MNINMLNERGFGNSEIIYGILISVFRSPL